MSIVTICIPVFNEAEKLPKLLKQIHVYCKNNDVIISDNGSKDKTNLIVKNYKKKLSKLRYYRLKKNFGFDHNYLNCVKQVKTKYFWVMGGDDQIYSDSILKIEKILNLLDGPDGITFVDNKNQKISKTVKKNSLRKIDIYNEGNNVGKISLNVIKKNNFITNTNYLRSNFGYIQVYYILKKIIKNKNWFILDTNTISRTNYHSQHYTKPKDCLRRLDMEIKGYYLKIKNNFTSSKNFKKYKKIIFKKNIRPWIFENLRVNKKINVLMVLRKNKYLLNEVFDFWILNVLIKIIPEFFLKKIINIKRSLINQAND